MKFVLFIAISLILLSCTDGEERVVDISDTIPKAQRNYDDVDTADVMPIETKVFAKFHTWDASIVEVRPYEKKHFLERFQPKQTEKLVLFYDSGDSVRFERLVYRDSLQTKSAFYNWLDRSNISHLGDEVSVHSNAFAMLYTDTVLLRLQGNVNFTLWEERIEQEDWISEGDLWMKQSRNRRMKWYTYTKGNFEVLKQP